MSRRLRSQILSCQRCALGEFSDAQEWHHVPWVGGRSNIAIIGEAPGQEEAFSGEPFVGRAGRVLDKALGSIHLSRDDVWIQNVICCRPSRNNFDLAIEAGAVEACRPWFNAQLEASGAWLVVLVGKKAYQAVMDEDVALGRVRGRFQWFDGRLWYPTWHPAYVLRQGPGSEVSAQWTADWLAVGQLLASEADPPPPEPIHALTGGQMRFYEPETGEVGTSKLAQRLTLDGWVGVFSPVLDDYLCIVDAKPRQKKPKIPIKWRKQPQWTTTELMMVSAGGKLSISVEEFRKINLAKRVLGGKVVA